MNSDLKIEDFQPSFGYRLFGIAENIWSAEIAVNWVPTSVNKHYLGNKTMVEVFNCDTAQQIRALGFQQNWQPDR